MNVVNLQEKLATFSEPWKARIVSELNDNYVKLVKFQGDFLWHHHESEDELFFVVKGTMKMNFRDESGTERHVIVRPGELLVVPRGVEHKPAGDEEVHVMLIEPKTTLNTGNVRNERTVDQMQRI